MKPFYIVGFLSFIFSLLLTCSENSTKPPDNGPDTTSHDFTFRLDTLGTHSSILNDVTVIDDNNIWAVGMIRVTDSSGGEEKYNAAVWNGQEWELKQVPFIGACSGVDVPEIKAVFFIDKTLIFTNGGAIVYYDFENFTIDCGVLSTLDGQIKKIWASSKEDIYVVGIAGSISHYNGSSWRMLDSGTNIDIQDIWGDRNPDSGEWEVLALASLQLSGREVSLLKINDTNYQVDTLTVRGLSFAERSIWFKSGQSYYVGGDGLYLKSALNTDPWVTIEDSPLLYKTRVRGLSSNDIFVSGSSGLISHYNGTSWRHHPSFGLPEFFGVWWSCDYRGRTFAAAGQLNNQGLVLIGKRTNE